MHTDRLYEALDCLLPHKEAIEKHLRRRFGELFELKCDLLLYDVTSTYFEGDMEGCLIAQRGYSRDSRGDRPQVCIGLVVTEEGFPLGYEVFAGNAFMESCIGTIKTELEMAEYEIIRQARREVAEVHPLLQLRQKALGTGLPLTRSV